MEKKNVKEMSIEELTKAKEELKNELKEVAIELIHKEVKNGIQTIIEENPDVKEVQDIKYIRWDFEPEYDDEGGYDYWPTGVTAYDKEDCEIDEEQKVVVKTTSSWSGNVYEENLKDVIHEMISERSSELYKYDVYEIEL